MGKLETPRPSRADVADYIHDMAIELAELAAKYRLSRVHDRLADAAREAQAAAARLPYDDGSAPSSPAQS